MLTDCGFVVLSPKLKNIYTYMHLNKVSNHFAYGVSIDMEYRFGIKIFVISLVYFCKDIIVNHKCHGNK